MSTLQTHQVQPSAPGTTPQQHAGTVQVADFEAIVLRYQGPITTFLLLFRITGNREQSYPLAQDVCVNAYKALLGGAIVQETRLSAWLFRIATNTAYVVLRRRRPIAWPPLSRYSDDRGMGKVITGAALPDLGRGNEEGKGCGPAGSAFALHFPQGDAGGCCGTRVDDRELIDRVCGLLPPTYAICLWLYEHAGLSCTEIADVLNISASAVKKRLKQARERFVTLYQETGALPVGGTE